MKRVFIGVAAGIGVSLLVYKLAKDGKLDGICNDMTQIADKTKRSFRNSLDVSKNQLEYLKDRAMSKTDQIGGIVEDAEKSLMEKLKKAKG